MRKVFDKNAAPSQGAAPDVEVKAVDKACGFCGHMTPHGTLVDFGNRCFPCYQYYCRQTQTFPDAPVMNGSRAWALRLKWRRDKNGEKLTRVQTDAMATALHEGEEAGV